MVAKEAVGALIMSTVAVLDTAIIVANRMLQEREWPAMRFMAAAFFVVAVVLATGLVLSGSIRVSLPQFKWIMLRGICGTASLTLEILAIRTGMAAGDLAALTSINTVLSAIFGRLFLGEELRRAHGISLSMSVVGAVLISRPGPLAATATSGMSLAGFLFAAASGFTTASLFICSRKSAGVSPLHLCCGTTAVGAPLLWLLSLTPVVEDFSLQPIVQFPQDAAIVLGVLSLLSLLAVLCVSTGAQWCPAMVSATVNTGSRMVGGYIAQVVLFGMRPEPITLTGAILLFASVVIVALARVRDQSEDKGKQEPTPTSESNKQDAPGSEANAPAEAEEVEEESLAHFVASEFVEFEPHQQPLRQRRATKSINPGVQMFGVGMDALGVAA